MTLFKMTYLCGTLGDKDIRYNAIFVKYKLWA